MKMMWFIYPFCSIFIILGAVISCKTYISIYKAKQTKHWPSVEAKIDFCDMEEHSDSDGVSYEVKVQYTYSVTGINYTGKRINPAYIGSSGEEQQELYRKIMDSETVLAYYNPSDYSEAYLIRGTFGFHKTPIYMGLLFLSAGLFFLLTFHYAFTGSSNYADKLTTIKKVQHTFDEY